MKYPAQSDLWRLNQTMGKPNLNNTSRVLGRFRQIFPLSFFPSELIVEELRIIWVFRYGPWARNIISIMATDIACVNATSGLFFGHIHVKSLTGGPEIMVNNLSRSDVLKVRNLIEGIALSSREGLKIEKGNIKIEREDLIKAGNFVAA